MRGVNITVLSNINLIPLRSAAGVTDLTNRQQQQLFQSVYVKGSEFVEAIIGKKGPEFIANAFLSPPESTRQILYPEEYLDPSVAASLDCSKLLQKVTGELPTEGMRSQTVAIGTMTLRAMLISKGIPEKEAIAVADNCLNGALITIGTIFKYTLIC